MNRREFLKKGLVGVVVGILFISGCGNLLGPDYDVVLEVFIEPDKSVYSVGEHPEISVKIYNKTQKPIWLVGSLEDSDIKWRYPYCWFDVYDEKGTNIREIIPRCGFMSNLSKENFVLVQPGQFFDPYMEGFSNDLFMTIWKPEKSGIYRVVFNYSTKSDDISEWLCPASDEYCIELFHKVPKDIELKSEKTIEVI